MIEYNFYKKALDSFLGKFLGQFQYKLISENAQDFEITYGNETWNIEFSMFSNFPCVELAYCFKNKHNKIIKGNLLEKVLQIDTKDLLAIDEKIFDKDYYGLPEKLQFQTQMKYIKIVLAKYYKPILTGRYKSEKFEEEHSE